MSNAVAINLDGTPRSFGFTLSSAREFKYGYKMTLLDAFQTDPDTGLPRMLDTVTLTWILWAGLQRKEKTSFDKVEKMLQAYLDGGGSLKALFEHVAEAAKVSGLFGIESESPNEPAEAE